MHQKVLSMILVLVMLLGLLSVSAFTTVNTTSSDSAASNDDSFYRIVHLDCGRKYFTKDWIIALLNEMKADGYNQLQLAFGNDGLRFLLDDMSFEANGTTYSHSDVVSKVEAGNKAQNSSGDTRWLKQSEMDDIISAANALGIEIVPLLNLPGHANAILDIADDKYNASGSNNTLNVASSEEARNFGMAIFKKYVDYFAGKGCKFFNFGADEYANDASGTFSFGRLESTEYATFVSFINSLAEYIENKGMTPRAFNDGLYYNGQSASIDTKIQCCYWSPGWNGYKLASASAIANKHAMINTNGGYYYILGKDDKFDSGYSYAANFKDTTFPTYNQWTGTWGTETVSNPVGSMFCIWCDNPNAENAQTVAQKVRLPMRAMALRMNDQSIDGMDTSVVANGFKADGKLNTGSTGGSETENVVNITVAVGGTFEKTVSGANYARDEGYTTADETVASVVVNGEDATKSEPIYDSVDVSYSTLAGNNSAWAKTNYYYKDGDEYCPVYAYKQTEGILWWATTTYHYGYMPDGETAVKEIGNATENSTVKVYEYKGIKEGTLASTTITFTGHKVGDTTVVIGGVTYKIHVIPEDLSKVTPLKLEYWITNAPISTVSDTYDTRTNTKSESYKAYYTAIAADYNVAVATADGVDVTTFAPAKTGHESRDVYYWRCRMLDTALTNTSTNQTEQQTNDAGDDETVSGIGFTKIRYYESKWQVFTDNNAWVDVTSTKQLVAYYREYIKVTDEVESFAADWGKLGDGSVSGTYLNPSSVNTISYQVVYEDGKTNPSATTAAALASKTLCYGHWDNGRGIGTIMLSDTADYEIYKVTAETGTMNGKSNSSGDYGNYTVSSFSWNKDEATVWDEESDQKETNGDVVIHNNANTPNKEGNYRNLTWLDNKESILIRVYVRAKTVDGALTVHYVDETTSAEFYNYNIIVSNTASNKTTFKENISLANPWKGDLVNGDVVNKFGATQTVTADLGKMPAIPAKYRYAVDYTCVRVVRSADGTEVTLYYTFKTDKTFVVDFGLPLVIQPTDISASLSLAKLTSVTAKSSTKTDYAEIITNSENCNITYKLKTMLNGADKLDVKYDGQIPVGDGTQTGSVSYEVGIIPASTVYYEDNFISFEDNDGTWEREGKTTTNAVQDLDALMAKKTYGYDSHYTSSSAFSLGSAMKTTVSSETNSNPPTATFTFKGTGFDLVSMTSKDTGTILVNVNGTTEDNKTVTEHWIVDTFYGYTRKPDGYIQYTWTKGEDGKWHNKAEKIPDLPAGAKTGGTPVNSDDVTYELNYIWTRTNVDDNALYQIPVIHYTDLPYGTYTVTVTPKYSSKRDPYYQAGGANNNYDFYLDGVRIYNPAGDKLNSQYVKDGEGYAQFTEIRNMLLKASDLTANIQPTKGMVFVDGVVDKGTLKDYTNYGPNNEVYLSTNQAIAFKISDMNNVDSIQIGAKAPKGNATMQIKVGTNESQTQPLTTASDMYYKLKNVQAGQTIVITNTGDNLLSLTTLKVTYKNAPTATNSAKPIVDSDVLAQAPVMLTSMLYGEPETFEPEHFTAKWSRSVRKGGTATLTVKASADVESITVNGEKITAYTTKTARSFWGPKETYHVFTYRVTNAATADYTVCALNAEGVASDPITAPLTVRPSIRDWWNGIFDKWKH